MGKPKAPKPPDPRVVANAQADANIKTAQTQTDLNRFDQKNDFGSVLWTQDPNNPNKYTSTASYNPTIQALLAAQQGNALDVMQAGRNAIPAMIDRTGRATGSVDNTFNRTDQVLNHNLRDIPGRTEATNYFNHAGEGLYDPNREVANTMAVVPKANDLLTSQIDRTNRVFGRELNYNNAPAMPIANEQTRNAVSDAMYNRAASRLDPRFNQMGSDLESKLAAQGITQGSQAYDREIDNLARDRNDAYSIAQNDAEVMGTDAMQKLFGMGLSARQQGVNETNTIRDQASKEALVANQLAGGAVNNASNMMGADIARDSAQTAIANAMFDLDTKAFDNQLKSRGQMLSEREDARRTSDQAFRDTGNTLNFLNNSMPNLPMLTPNAGGAGTVGNTPIADATYNSFQGDMNRYNAQVGSQNNLMSGIAGLGSAALMNPGSIAGLGSGLAAGGSALAGAGSAALTGLMAF